MCLFFTKHFFIFLKKKKKKKKKKYLINDFSQVNEAAH